MKIFGWQIDRAKNEDDDLKNGNSYNKSPVTEVKDDGAFQAVSSGGIVGTCLDLDASFKDEKELIKKYRELALKPEAEGAIDDIVNDAIVLEDVTDVVTLNMEDLNLEDNIKDKIADEFDEVLTLLDFQNVGQDIFRRWYVDGRIFYQVIVDSKNPKDGIQKVKYIDATKIKKIREIQKDVNRETGTYLIKSSVEYFLYSDNQLDDKNNTFSQLPTFQETKFTADSIAHVTSGLTNATKTLVLSYLHKAIKPMNQLTMIEDAVVIYRLSRAAERRIFYIDVGNMSRQKAEDYLVQTMNRYKTSIKYDATTGEVSSDRKHLSMMEDFWFPRREGGKGTEVTTLPGGDKSVLQMDDVTYFLNKLYKSLNVPVSRLQQDGGMMNLGRASEISRDELKFSKFVNKLRTRFSLLFDELLKRQLILKGIISEEDWETIIRSNIRYVFAKDSYFSELKKFELMRERFAVVEASTPYIGRFISNEQVRKEYLMQTDEEIEKIDKEIAAEKNVEQYKIPIVPAMGGGFGADAGYNNNEQFGNEPNPLNNDQNINNQNDKEF